MESGTSFNADAVASRDSVSLSSLANLTGFPEEFLKKELLLEGDNISMDALRKVAMSYLESNSEVLKQ